LILAETDLLVKDARFRIGGVQKEVPKVTAKKKKAEDAVPSSGYRSSAETVRDNVIEKKLTSEIRRISRDAKSSCTKLYRRNSVCAPEVSEKERNNKTYPSHSFH
jgi:hypothetical protein